jgi:hypothetical protein
MELPTHPEDADRPADHQPPPQTNRTTWLVLATLGAIMAVVVILHLTGVMRPGG